MLRITFTPPGEQPRTFELKGVEELDALEAELIEDSGGAHWETFMHWSMQMAQGSIRAVRVLLWVLLRRENPALDLATFNFPVGALSVEETEDEPATEPEGKDEPDATGTSSP